MNNILAQNLTLPGGIAVQGPTGFDTKLTNVGAILTKIIPLIFYIAGFGLLLMIIGAGFTMLTSGGDAKKMEQAQQQLTYAIVGFIIIFAAFWLVKIFGTIFGVSIINSMF